MTTTFPLTPSQLDAIFGALAHTSRRTILARLSDGDATVNELTELCGASQPTVSRHLKVLEEAGLVSRSRAGQQRPCHLQADPLAEATAWLVSYREHWAKRFEALDALLVELQKPQSDTAN